MPSWAELKDFVHKRYEISDEQQDSFKLVFEYDNQRLQAVVVSRFEAMEREFCDLSAACCRASELDPREALKKSFGFAIGSLCLDHDVYVVRYSVPVDSMNLDDLELVLHLVASTAEQIDRDVSGSVDDL